MMPTQSDVVLTILMPCLNEVETLPICIHMAKTWMQNNPNVCAEILVADNGSTDGSQALAKELGARVIHVEQRGYGAALFEGCQQALGRYIVMGDSDASYDFKHLDVFLDKLEDQADLVMGNRFLGGISPGAMPWKNRYIGNPVLSFIGRCLFPIHIQDFHCGIRAISKEAFLKLDLRTTGMEFASEMVIKAALLELHIQEVPTTLNKDGRSGPPHLRPWRDGWRHLRFMLLFSPRWLFIYPGLILGTLFLFFYGALLQGPLNVGAITLDVHTLFYAQAGLVLSTMMLFTGSILRAFAFREGLLLKSQWLMLIRRSPVLEVGALLSIVMMILGFWWGVDAVITWGQVGFGSLTSGHLIRTVSLSTTLMMISGLGFLWSLVMGFVSLPLRQEVR